MSEQSLQTATSNPPSADVRGIYRELSPLMNAFQVAMQTANVLAPIVRPDFIPLLHAISLRVVQIDPRDDRGDVYKPQGAKDGERALTKTALDKISAAAGISWDPVVSGRLDDGKDPFYCRFRAVGSFIDFDGTRRQISGEKEMDLRDGSPTAARMTEKELRGTREHIQSHAESKARNRAIRSAFGLKQKYSVEELSKPFVVPKLVFTGETDDPEMRRAVANRLVERSLGAADQIYGATPDRPAIETTAKDLGSQAAPPVSATAADDDDDDAPKADRGVTGNPAMAASGKPPY